MDRAGCWLGFWGPKDELVGWRDYTNGDPRFLPTFQGDHDTVRWDYYPPR
jgi:hypothetical protein